MSFDQVLTRLRDARDHQQRAVLYGKALVNRTDLADMLMDWSRLDTFVRSRDLDGAASADLTPPKIGSIWQVKDGGKSIRVDNIANLRPGREPRERHPIMVIFSDRMTGESHSIPLFHWAKFEAEMSELPPPPQADPQPETYSVAKVSGDRTFLNWIADRLVNVHGENPNVDFVHTLRRMADHFGEQEPSRPIVDQIAVEVEAMLVAASALDPGNDKEAFVRDEANKLARKAALRSMRERIERADKPVIEPHLPAGTKLKFDGAISTTELGLPAKGTGLNRWIDEQIRQHTTPLGALDPAHAAEIARGAALHVISDKAALINNLANSVHAWNVAAGWWTDLKTGDDLHGKRNVGELLCLVHSEISEAMEGHRKGLPDDKLKHRPMFRVELIDAMIRLLDILGSDNREHPAGEIFVEKLEFNASRADHQPANRRAAGGKSY